MNLGFERTVLFTFGKRAGSSKSTLNKPPLVRFLLSPSLRLACCFTFMLVAERLITFMCYFVYILLTELDLRILGGPSTSGMYWGALILAVTSPPACDCFLCWLISATLINFSYASWWVCSLFMSLTICRRAKVLPKAWLYFFFCRADPLLFICLIYPSWTIFFVPDSVLRLSARTPSGSLRFRINRSIWGPSSYASNYS